MPIQKVTQCLKSAKTLPFTALMGIYSNHVLNVSIPAIISRSLGSRFTVQGRNISTSLAVRTGVREERNTSKLRMSPSISSNGSTSLVVGILLDSLQRKSAHVEKLHDTDKSVGYQLTTILSGFRVLHLTHPSMPLWVLFPCWNRKMPNLRLFSRSPNFELKLDKMSCLVEELKHGRNYKVKNVSILNTQYMGQTIVWLKIRGNSKQHS